MAKILDEAADTTKETQDAAADYVGDEVMKVMTVGGMGLQSADVIARQKEADFVDRQKLQSGIYPQAGSRRVRKGERCSALLRAILYCTIGAAHEGRREGKKWIRWAWRGIGISLLHTQLQGERERAAWPWCAQV